MLELETHFTRPKAKSPLRRAWVGLVIIAAAILIKLFLMQFFMPSPPPGQISPAQADKVWKQSGGMPTSLTKDQQGSLLMAVGLSPNQWTVNEVSYYADARSDLTRRSDNVMRVILFAGIVVALRKLRPELRR